MARLKDVKEFKRTDMFNIPVDQIHVEPGFNIRIETDETRAEDERLFQLIMKNGYMRSIPMIVQQEPNADGKAVLVNGHRRLKAVKRAIEAGMEIVSIPCVPEGQGTSEVDRTAMLFSSNDGLRLTAEEQILGIKRMLSMGLEIPEIAERISRSPQHVSDLLTLASAPIEVAQMVKSGELSATTAIRTVRKNGKKAVEVLTAAKEASQRSGSKKITPRSIEAVSSKLEPIEATEDDCESLPVVVRRHVNLWLSLRDEHPELVDALPKAFVASIDHIRELL